FPSATYGFLYFWAPPTGSPLPWHASSIRFRRTASSVPSDFDAGTDLMHPTGIPWGIPFPAICAARGLLG
ncbi:hypothetical protein DFH09DRAFT_829489, partial [Mycena vulgaris]